MANFDLIQCGYNTADETINFGTRLLADGVCPYEASTSATLKCSEGTSESPTIRSVAQNNHIYVTVNNSLKIFQDKDCSEVIYNVIFDSIIDTFCVLTGTEYILICLRNGTVNVIDGNEGEYNCMYSGNLDSSIDTGNQQLFCVAFEAGELQFLVVSKHGQVHKLLIAPLDTQKVVAEKVHNFNIIVENAAFLYPLLLVNGSQLSVLDLETGAIVFHQGKLLKQVFPMGHMFFGLDFEGCLFRICPFTLLVFPVKNEVLYKNMLFVNNEDNKVLVVITKEDEDGHSFIQSLSYPDFSIVYSLKLIGEAHLITPESVFDETMYISEIIQDNHVKELRIQMIYETEPFTRLQRLLKKQQFAEAEVFARNFNLELDMINRAKAQVIVDKILCESEDIDQLIQLLDEIDDIEFKVESCINIESSCKHSQDVHRILKYGCATICSKSDDISIGELQEIITNLMYRFETFTALNQGVQFNVWDWSKFASCNLLREVKKYLESGSIDEATIIYSRLQDSKTTLTNFEVENILGVLNELPIDSYPAFLKTFVPVTLTALPSSLHLFLQWIQKKVFYMEQNARLEFPDNAISFVETMAGLLKGFAVQNVAEIHSIISGLSTLKVLKEKYKISLPLVEYLSGPQSVVRYLLNIKMCPEDYGSFLNTFLLQFILQNQMEPNNVFLNEISILVNSKSTHWENVVSPILNCITSIQNKVDAILIILRSAQVPWSRNVRKLAQSVLKYSHPSVVQVEDFFKAEPIIIVLARPEYEITERRLVNLKDLIFYINRIMYCNLPTMVEDVLNLCTTPQHRHEANLLLIKKFIRNCDLDNAVQIFHNNTPEERTRLAKELLPYLELFVTSSLFCHLREHCYYFLGLILNQLDQETQLETKFLKTKIDLLKNMINLNKKFNLDVTMRDLYKPSGKAEIADKLIQMNSSYFEENDVQLFRICQTISSSLSYDRDRIILKCCSIVNNYQIVLNSGEFLLSNSCSPENLCLMAVLLLKLLNVNNLPIQNNTFLILNDTVVPETDSSQSYKGLILAEQIAIKALFYAKPEEAEACMEVVNWVNISTYFSAGQENKLKTFLFGDTHRFGSMLPGSSTFEIINRLFTIYNNFIGQFYLSNQYLTYFKSEDHLSIDELLEELEVLPTFIKRLYNEGQECTAYKIVETLQTCLRCFANSNPAVNYLNKVLIKQCMPTMLQALLRNNSIDSNLIYNLLLACDQAGAIKFTLDSVRIYKRQPEKFVCLAKIALKLFNYYKVRGRSQLLEAKLAVKWWRKFENDLNYETFCKASAEEKLDMLFNLNIDVKLVTSYCDDFSLELQPLLLRFFKKTLLNWKPDYSIESNSGCKSIHVKNNENELYDKCVDIISVINNKEEILSSISSFWNTLNYYHYEVFMALLKIVSLINPNIDNTKKVFMLVFLKNYQRISQASEMENEQWYSTFPDTQSVDPLSQFRLPFSNFLFSSDIWTIIRPEINLKTYKFWFGAISILNAYLNKDEICSYVIKDVVASGVLKNSDDHWTLYPKHETLFQEINECVQNMDDLERATSVVYHLMTHTPKGADLVIAATLCYRFARKYRMLKPDLPDVEKAVTKIEKKYYNFYATHILHRYQLNDEKYISLVSKPSALITALYLDDRIVKKTFSFAQLCPDINKAVDDLGELFSLNIAAIRDNLVENWLSNSNITDFNTSFATNSQKEDNLKRAAYIFCADSENLMKKQSYLLNIGLRHDNNEKERSDICKAMALKLFALITDDDTIFQLTQLTSKELTITIDKLTLIDNLQYLGFSLDMHTLDGYNKKELLKRLAQRSENSLVIETMATICTTYNIYNIKYWKFIVSNAVKLSMFSELKRYIELQPIAARYQSFYVNAWEKLINHLFSSLPENVVTEDLINNFLILQSCPVLFSLNLEYCFKKCLTIGKEEFAAVLLQYFDNVTRIQLVEEIKATNNFIEKLDKLSEQGICGVSFVKSFF